MAGASTTLHESPEQLTPLTRNIHRAIVSMQEELEAIDWYRQRADATDDAQLKELLLHNMGEEMEHATLLLEWIRRHEPLFDHHLRTYLFTTAPLLAIEAEQEARELGEEKTANMHTVAPRPSFTIGTMKGG